MLFFIIYVCFVLVCFSVMVATDTLEPDIFDTVVYFILSLVSPIWLPIALLGVLVRGFFR